MPAIEKKEILPGRFGDAGNGARASKPHRHAERDIAGLQPLLDRMGEFVRCRHDASFRPILKLLFKPPGRAADRRPVLQAVARLPAWSCAPGFRSYRRPRVAFPQTWAATSADDPRSAARPRRRRNRRRITSRMRSPDRVQLR